MSGELKCGDKILLSGVVYTARDAAHKRFNALLDEGKELPIDFLEKILSRACEGGFVFCASRRTRPKKFFDP